MNLKYILLLSAFSLLSCKKETKIPQEEKIETVETIETVSIVPDQGFHFDDFRIEKGHLGPIKIGMSLEEAETHLKDLSKKLCDPLDFGFDGGGDAFIYYFNEEPILALIPERDTNTLLAIAAVHKNLKTANGVYANASIKEIQQAFPDIALYQNEMMNWEFMLEEKNDWEFVFMKGPEHPVGEYENSDAPGKIKDSGATADWVTIR